MGTSIKNTDLPGNKVKEQYALGFKLVSTGVGLDVGGSASKSNPFGNLSGLSFDIGASAEGNFNGDSPKISKDGNIIIKGYKEFFRRQNDLIKKAWSNKYVKAFITGNVVAGLAGQVLGAVGGLCYLALTKLGGLPTLSALWGGFISTTRFVLNFNWNTTDKEIDEQIESSIKSLYGLLGGAVGSATGYITCGAIPGAVAFAYNKTLGTAILRNLSEEAKDEVLGQVAALAWASGRSLANAAFLNLFKGARRWLKQKDTPQYNLLKELIGEKNLKAWGEEGTPAYTFSGDIEERVQKIPDERLRSFTEEFLEEFGESCVEAGYIVTNTIESHLAAQKMMQDEARGPERVIEIEFNRSSQPAK